MGVGAKFTEKLTENRVGSELMVNTYIPGEMGNLQATRWVEGPSWALCLQVGKFGRSKMVFQRSLHVQVRRENKQRMVNETLHLPFFTRKF